jgi:hypothetical protein
MKRGILFLATLVMISVNNVISQTPPREKLDAYRIAFFTKRLNLTSQEAEKFWPVYNEFQSRKNALQLDRSAIIRSFNQNELNMTEKEMTESADKLIALEVQEASLAQEYHRKFKEILSPVKVMRLYQAENQYRLMLLQELKQNQELRNNLQKKGPGQGGGLQDQSGPTI